jgi:hypothetical protein
MLGTRLAAYADTNRIAILFPQTSSRYPDGSEMCWDWWGQYKPIADFDTKDGAQVRLVHSILLNMTATLGH